MVFEDDPACDIQMSFGRRNGLPSQANAVYIGNVYLNKNRQYDLIKGQMPTINTFGSHEDIDGEFIAKKATGHKQQGQMINQVPDEDDYIFQPLIEIIKEYRVIVYYMNGKHHISGVYEKTGSNMSLKSINAGSIHGDVVDMAIRSCELCGYGFGGVDIALTNISDNISESISGTVTSTLGNLYGKTSRKDKADDETLVFLEINTMPSMANPMISQELLKSVLKNKQ